MPDPIPTGGAVDLGDLKTRLNERDAALQRIAEERAMSEAQQVAIDWDKQMQRAFKGIFSRPQRHAFLRRMKDSDAD